MWSTDDTKVVLCAEIYPDTELLGDADINADVHRMLAELPSYKQINKIVLRYALASEHCKGFCWKACAGIPCRDNCYKLHTTQVLIEVPAHLCEHSGTSYPPNIRS